jgi:methylmalonyl-CoA mutase N-terminal domain/subunit
MAVVDSHLPVTEKEWEAAYQLSPQRDAPFTTLSGEPVEPLYTERDLFGDREAQIGLPGQFPFTRGVYPSMYRGRLWTMRQFAGFGTAEETNERFRYLLAHGQTGLSTAFDMPSLMGHDSDHPRSEGEVGREGVAVDTRRCGGSPTWCSGALRTCRAGTRSAFRAITSARPAPRPRKTWRSRSRTASPYVEHALARGLCVDDFAPRLSFFFNAQIDFFEEIAKYRAARRIWARELRDTYGAKNPKSWLMRFHTQTAGVSLTAQQPLNNIVRTSIEALAGVLGGTQSLHTNSYASYDEALALPTEAAVRIALRTQQIIAHETGVTNTIDPLGGSYFLEALTDRMEERAYEYFRRIDQLGGMVQAVKDGYPQREIADAAFELQTEIDAGRRIVVGVNAFTEADETATPILRIDPALERKQIERVRAAKAERDSGAVERALGGLTADAASARNLIPSLLEAARAHVTEGEMVQALQRVWGDYRERPVF